LFASSGFEFNQNSPIKALGKKFFFKAKDDRIYLDFLNEDTIINDFQLPKVLDKKVFSEDSLPSYNLPAVN
jgi:hypothetical protein